MFFAFLQDNLPEAQTVDENDVDMRDITEEDVQRQATFAHHNQLLRSDLEKSSTVSSGGGWWFEAHCGVVFFCCR